MELGRRGCPIATFWNCIPYILRRTIRPHRVFVSWSKPGMHLIFSYKNFRQNAQLKENYFGKFLE